MKVSLVVAQGVHQGKVIPIPVTQFLIGREDGCQLRPSSPAISKKHCGILVKANKIFVADFGSTNGTFVNDTQVTGEVEAKDGDKIRVGPLEFVLKVDGTLSQRAKPKSTPLAPATPAPKEEPTKEQKPVAKQADSGNRATTEPDEDQLAAMLLSTDDGPTAGGPVTADQIPSGSTVFDMSAVDDPNKTPEQKKPPAPEQDNSKRAADILRKYMQRPRSA